MFEPVAVRHEVWARMVWAAIDLAELGGLPTEHLFQSLPFDAVSVRRLKRVAWDDYCVLVENIGRLSGDGLEDLLEAGYHQVFPEIRAVVGAVIDSKPLYRLIFSIANPIVFPAIEHRIEDLGGREVRITLRLRPGARPCETYFRGSIGGIRGMTRHLDLPPAMVVHDIGPEHGTYDVTLPASRTLATRIRSAATVAIRTVLGINEDGSPVRASFGDVPADPIDARVASAVVTWKLTPRQTEVLHHLAHDESYETIARALGCTQHVIEVHVEQLLRKTGAASRMELIDRLWSAD